MTLWENPKRLFVTAFVIGALVHAVLLALSLTSSAFSHPATVLLLVIALPGAMVDMSSEMLHPSKLGGFLLAIVGTMVNGGVYLVGAWIAFKLRNRLHASGPR
jgi:hypothetical protein